MENISKYLYFISFFVLLNSCNKITKISSKYNRSNAVLLKSCILVSRRDDVKSLVGETHQLLINDGKIENHDFFLQKGDTVYIEQVYDIVSDTRGNWIGAQGHWIDNQNNKIQFIYCWSKVSKLELAPWESDVPANRNRIVPQDIP